MFNPQAGCHDLVSYAKKVLSSRSRPPFENIRSRPSGENQTSPAPGEKPPAPARSPTISHVEVFQIRTTDPSSGFPCPLARSVPSGLYCKPLTSPPPPSCSV